MPNPSAGQLRPALRAGRRSLAGSRPGNWGREPARAGMAGAHQRRQRGWYHIRYHCPAPDRSLPAPGRHRLSAFICARG